MLWTKMGDVDLLQGCLMDTLDRDDQSRWQHTLLPKNEPYYQPNRTASSKDLPARIDERSVTYITEIKTPAVQL